MLLLLIPPVTIGGISAPVVANLFDSSGNFRQQNGSFKRQRVDGGGGPAKDGFYNLSRDVAAPSLPPTLRLDVGRIRDLLVKANEMATTIRSRFVSESAPEGVRELAGFSIALLDLVSAVVEEGIVPMSSSGATSFASVAAAAVATPAAPSRPHVEPRTAELKAALAATEKSAVIFDADLRPSLVANRVTLNGAFAAGLKAATVIWLRRLAETPVRESRLL